MAINDIVQTIAEARVDARSLSEFMFKPAGFKVTRRLAPSINTLEYYLNLFNKTATDGAAMMNQVVLSSGFITIDSFELGATLTQRNQALRHAADGRLYRWAGDLPKNVPASSTPMSTGGFGDNAWLEVSDITLRQELLGEGGAVKIGSSIAHVDSTAKLKSATWLKQGAKVLVGDNGKQYKIVPDSGALSWKQIVLTGISGRAELVYPLERFADVSVSKLPRGIQTRSSTFNDQLGTVVFSDGQKMHYAGQQPYDKVDFTLRETVTTYYVDFKNGLDSQDGLTDSTAFKLLDKALKSMTGSTVIVILDDVIGLSSVVSPEKNITHNLKIIGRGKSGKTILTSIRDGLTSASFAWTDNGDGSWTTAVPLRTFNVMFDRRYLDDWKLPVPLEYVDSKALCQSTKGSFYQNTANTELTVHLSDGRKPDVITEGGDWIPVSTEHRTEFRSDAATILFENMDFSFNQGAVLTGGMKTRPITVSSKTTATVGLKNCNSYGSNGNGFQIDDAMITVLLDCKAQYNYRDGFNYHSQFVGAGTGSYISVYEYGECKARYCGYLKMRGQGAISYSNNGSTSHDAINVERLNTQCDYTYGAVIADVGGAVSENWNVRASQPNVGATPTIPKACYWADNGGKIWLWGCYGDEATADTLAFSTFGGGEIYIKNWLGAKDVNAEAKVNTLFNYDGVEI